jgi:DNA repair protein RecO (recombination protein O)
MNANVRRVGQAQAYLLHQHPWQDTGRILELLTRDYGRMSVFALGVRGPKSRLAGVLRPFAPLLVSWVGKGEAPRLIGAEAAPQLPGGKALPATAVMSAFYVSELVINLTARHDAQPELYDHYDQTLTALRQGEPLERTLRLFEKRLLDVLGYGIPASHQVSIADPLGLSAVSAEVLQCLAEERLDDPAVLELVRPVLRRALAHCLDGRALKTRTVAQALLNLKRATR